jgi:hypothetical protein
MASTVEVTKVSKRVVRVEITSDCDKVTAMGKSLPDMNQFDALKPPVDSKIYQYSSEHHLCASCPVPMAILKAIEVETGLALPRSVVVHLENI